MSQILYNKGHTIPQKIIENTLRNLNCKSIENNDYAKDSRTNVLRFDGIIPDYLCYYFGEKCAIEIGDLNHGVGLFHSKINKLLQHFKYVIHIFADENYFLLHTILYERKDIVSSDIIGKIRLQQQKCIEMLSQLEEAKTKTLHH